MKKRYIIAAGALLILVALPATRTRAQDAAAQFFRSVELHADGGWLWLGLNNTMFFEGSTTDAFQTQLTVVNPTVDNVATLANTTGHVPLAEDGVTASGIRAGSVTLDGSNPTSVTTGLSVILACEVEQMAAATPNDDPIGFTLDTHAVAGRLDIYAFANASGTDPTWVASTQSTVLLRWFCIGTP